MKPNVRRDQKNSGVRKHYSCHGWRKNPLESGKNGQYVFKKSATNEVKPNVVARFFHLVETMKRTADTLICSSEEHKVFLVTKDLLNLPSIAGGKYSVATQFSSGVGYWIRIHFDVDYYFSV